MKLSGANVPSEHELRAKFLACIKTRNGFPSLKHSKKAAVVHVPLSTEKLCGELTYTLEAIL